MTPRFLAILTTGAIAGLVATTAHATQYTSEYSVTAFGFRIASTAIQATIDGDSYTITGNMKTAGLVRLFSTTDGNLTANGAYSLSSVRPSGFDLQYTDNGTDKRITMGFAGTELNSVERTPPPSKGSDWVEVPASELTNVVDPLAASLIPADSLRQVCDRTLRLYDGALRADIKLRYKRTIPFSTRGYKGDAVTCTAQFVPIAGFNKSKREIASLRDKATIEASFAPIAGTNLFAPVKVRVRMDGTTVNVTATRFEQL